MRRNKIGLLILLFTALCLLTAACSKSSETDPESSRTGRKTTAAPENTSAQETADPASSADRETVDPASSAAQETAAPGPQQLTPDELWSKNLMFRVEEILPENDQDRFLALFPDGERELWGNGTESYILDRTSGEKVPILLTTVLAGENEEEFRSLSVGGAAPASEDPDTLWTLHGIEILRYKKQALCRPAFRNLTRTDSNLLSVTAGNIGLQGMVDPDTGELFLWGRVIEGLYPSACSVNGNRMLLSFPSTSAVAGVLDLNSREISAVVLQKPEGMYSQNMTWLADGSLCTLFYKDTFYTDESSGEKRVKRDWQISILREDGGQEQYDLGESGRTSGGILISNDSNYVIVSWNSSRTVLIDRSSGEISWLLCENSSISAVPQTAETEINDSPMHFLDCLDDGETLLFLDVDSSLVMFRPDTLESRIIPREESELPWAGQITGDHRGQLAAASWMARDGSPAPALRLSLTDRDHPEEPLFLKEERTSAAVQEKPDLAPSGSGELKDSVWVCDYFEFPGYVRGFDPEMQQYGMLAEVEEITEGGYIRTEMHLVIRFSDLENETLTVIRGSSPGSWTDEQKIFLNGYFTSDGMVVETRDACRFHLRAVSREEANEYARTVLGADPENEYEPLETQH